MRWALWGEGVDGPCGGEGLLAEGFGFAALCGVEDEDAVGEGGDAGIGDGTWWRRGMRMLARPRAGQIMTDGSVVLLQVAGLGLFADLYF